MENDFSLISIDYDSQGDAGVNCPEAGRLLQPVALCLKCSEYHGRNNRFLFCSGKCKKA